MNNKIVNTSIASFLQRGFLAICSLIVTIVLSRLLTLSEFGIFSLVNAIVFFLVIVFSGGLQASMARFIALADDKQYRVTILYKGLSVLLPWVVLCTGFYYFFYSQIIVAVFSEESLVDLSLVIYGIALIEVGRLFIEKVGHGVGRLGIAAEQSAYSSFLLVTLVILTAWMVTTAEAVLWAKMIALGLPVPFALRKLMSVFQKSVVAKSPRVPTTTEIARYGLPLSLTSLAAYGFVQADLILLARYLDSASVGLYSICVFTYVRLVIVPQALGNGLAPHMARINQTDSWFSYFKKGILYALTFCMPVVIVGFFEGAEVLVFVFGEKYREAAGTFRLLSGYFLLASLLGVVNPILDFSGKANIRAIGLSLGCTVNILLNILWIPVYGVDGAAYSTLVGYLIFFTVVATSLRKGALTMLARDSSMIRLLLVILLVTSLVVVVRLSIPEYSAVLVVLIVLLVYPALLIGLKVYKLADFERVLKKIKR